MFDAKLANDILKQAMDNIIAERFLQFAQVATGFIIMYTLLRKLFVARSSNDSTLSKADIMRPLILMAIIFLFPYLLDFLDKVAAGLETVILENTMSLRFKPSGAIDTYLDNLEAHENDTGFEQATNYLGALYNYVTHPGIWFLDRGRSFFFALDKLIYGVALLTRGFNLYLLRLFGPFAILASMYQRYEGVAANWLKFYMLNYIWVALLYAINLFCETAYTYIIDQKLSGVEDEFSFITSLSFLVMLIVKFRLYKRSYEFLLKLFSNG